MAKRVKKIVLRYGSVKAVCQMLGVNVRTMNDYLRYRLNSPKAESVRKYILDNKLGSIVYDTISEH